MHDRENALKEWIEYTLPNNHLTLTPLAGDASFRRYFRLYSEQESYIIMDAPPDKEDVRPFIHIAQVLAQAQIPVPALIASNLPEGFLLLSDLGDSLLLDCLNTKTANHYYLAAMKTLCKIQSCPISDPELPIFDSAFMLREMSLCQEWFFEAYLSLQLNGKEQQLLEKTLNWVAAEVAKQPLIFIHRDYHSRNLMLIDDRAEAVLGVIDFQDAMSGPITYDLVSLLKDCYISWPREQVVQWVSYFYEHHTNTQVYSLSEFIRAFDLCGLQRHLKVLGVFARLYLRDNKAGYLANLPLTLSYVLECCELYPELHAFFDFLQQRVSLP